MEEDTTYICSDCQHEFTSSDKGRVRCPNCGGSRVVCHGQSARIADESEDISKSTDETDEVLKTFSERTVSIDEVERTFSRHGISETPESLVNAGYATFSEDGRQLCFSERPDLKRKLFCNLEISVTRILGLDPVDSKEALIRKLSPSMPKKAIILIHKAHGLVPPCEGENWIEDSRILDDLREQHGGSEMGLSGFQGLLREQYNDAPSDILDKLVSLGAINIAGNRVIILK